jgi:hypothetical protein
MTDKIGAARFFFVQHTKMGQKYTKQTQNIPNDHLIYRMTVKQTNGIKIFQQLPLQDHPKFTQSVILV